MSEADSENQLSAITDDVLTPLVCDALGVDSAQLLDKRYDALRGGMGGLYRFHGQARVQDERREWALILKIIDGADEYYSDDPAAWNYWKREALAYESGVLDDLPGQLRAPRCFAVKPISENETWIWLEAIAGESPGGWHLDRYGVAARHLGQFNGAYLEGRSLPAYNWLSRGRISEWLSEANNVIPRLQEYLGHSPIASWFSEEIARRTARMWSQRKVLLQGISLLPRTLCHHDAFRKNLMVSRDQSQRDITVAVDWALLGTGAIGEEIATTFTVTLQFLDCDAQFAPQLDTQIFDGYLAGLRDAGWNGKAELARFGFCASAVLFMALGAVGAWLPWLMADNGPQEIEEYLGHSLEEILNQWSRMQLYLLDLGDEALALQEVLE